MIALTCVLTIIVRIPSPTKGYMNLGDCSVLICGWLLGPIYGTIAGGLGSAFADFLSGYPIYIPATLIIKSIMAFIMSLVPYIFFGKENRYMRLAFGVSAVIAELFMVFGYYLYEAVVIGEGFITAFSGVFGNVAQGIAGIIGAYFILEFLSRTKVVSIYKTVGFKNKK